MIVDQLLTKVKTLRNATRFSSVSVCPDRFPEQCKILKELVKELKRKAKAKPEKCFFISLGEIEWREKASN